MTPDVPHLADCWAAAMLAPARSQATARIQGVRRGAGRSEMKRSTDRILTTHAGSLPRPPDLWQMVIAKSSGKPYDQAALDRRVRGAVAEVVQQQVVSGIDVVND